MEVAKLLSDSLQNGFVDCSLTSLERYNPKLLVNDYKRNMKVLTTIENELRSCEEFYFSVAFITESGIASLINVLTELNKRGIKGKIITSQYQNFTQPKALKKLLCFNNIRLKIVTLEEANFHAKGYIFKHADSYTFIIGSSNLTQNALCQNKEWNIKLSSLEEGSVMQNVIKEFNWTFDNATEVDERWIETYERIYKAARIAQQKVTTESETLLQLRKVNPNKMQTEAMFALDQLRKQGKNKALLISATGTGKTYLSAFDVSVFKPQRFLFVVHRENIARAAMESFKKILGYNISTGILTGREKNFDKQYTFATIQTLSQENTMNQFQRDYFDYIVIDEVHRSGAATYQRILSYFSPKFLLGMTATPERTDGYDIFNTFDYNIAYEIRLNKALEENMLAPFHYFGVSEIEIDGKLLDDNADFNKLVCDERVNRIIENALYYGYDGEQLKGLVFCSRTREARELSKEFNTRGFNTIALDGDSTENEREDAIKSLESDDSGSLQYIFTVDIFNEGVDIPTVNQIIMLRPTQSAIIFVQQLGRGLRKVINKEFLTVIDFIGNYSNNYLVPIALYGDRSYNKDTIRKLINNGSSTIPGCSTVSFDEITKERIYKAIDNTNMSKIATLKNEYQLMKYQIGRQPMMMDFMNYGAREPYAFVQYAKSSFYEFVKKVDQDNKDVLNKEETSLLSFYSKEILNGKRIEEVIILAQILVSEKMSFSELCDITLSRFDYTPSKNTFISAIRNLNGEFLKDDDKAKYGIENNIIVSGDTISMTCKYKEKLTCMTLHKYLNDQIKYAFERYIRNYDKDKFREGLVLYEKYSRKDVCRILNWDRNEESTIYGYRIKHNTCPIFVTYHKSDDVSGSTNYEDEFVNPNCFSWMTRNRVTLDSPEVVLLNNSDKTGLRIPLFVKKSDGEGSDFYYMGDMQPTETRQTTIKNDDGKILPIVNFIFKMKDEVEESIYTYISKNNYTP